MCKVRVRNLIVSLLVAAKISSAARGAEKPASSATNPPPETAIVLPEPIPDPLERMNRRLWAINETAVKGVIQPSSKAYRLLVPPPLRIGVSNVGRNLQYPSKIVNNLLQERWSGARDESYRFLCNSVLGMGGFLDVASELKIPRSDADSGQTFGRWGWNPNFYLMLPILGPSSDRDAAGTAADALVNPITYFSPYSYIPTGARYNELSDAVDGYVRAIDSEMDPYSLLRYAAALQRKEAPIDWELHGPQDAPSLETLKVVLFGPHDPQFPDRGKTREVKIPGTGRELPYTVWLQKTASPIVYLLPGIGAHRLNAGALGLAELLYEKGYSVAVISSAFNFEFIDRALTADLPGYAISDVKDIHQALTEIDKQLHNYAPGKIGRRAVMGYSMGGFHTLFLAATAAERSSLLQFDRYVAIDTPVRLVHGIEQLDAFYGAALDWPAAERTQKIEQLLLKVAALTRGKITGESALPLSATESKFLIGLAFRLNLRDVIFFTQLRRNQGVLKESVDRWKREPAYREIMNYSFNDYLAKFIDPYYRQHGVDLEDPAVLDGAVDLRKFEASYRAQKSVRLVCNQNDILNAAEDVQWLENTFGERLTLFPHGGHLGNLGDTVVQWSILNALTGLEDARPSDANPRSRASLDGRLTVAQHGWHR